MTTTGFNIDGANEVSTNDAFAGVTTCGTVGANVLSVSATVLGVTVTAALAVTVGANVARDNATTSGVTVTAPLAVTVGANGVSVNAATPGTKVCGVTIVGANVVSVNEVTIGVTVVPLPPISNPLENPLLNAPAIIESIYARVKTPEA